MYRGPRILNEAGSGDGGDGGNQGGEGNEAEAAAKAEAEAKAEQDKKGKETEGRISDLTSQIKELRTKLQEKEDAEKKAEEDQMKKKGELQKLLDTKEKELAGLTETSTSQKTKLEAYEAIAAEQVSKALESIKDEERRADAQELLEGRDLAEQFKLLPKLLKLAGTEKAGFGNPSPTGTQTPGQTDVATKKARYAELLGKGSLSPQERVEKNRLMNELSAVFQKEQEEQRAKSE